MKSTVTKTDIVEKKPERQYPFLAKSFDNDMLFLVLGNKKAVVVANPSETWPLGRIDWSSDEYWEQYRLEPGIKVTLEND